MECNSEELFMDQEFEGLEAHDVNQGGISQDDSRHDDSQFHADPPGPERETIDTLYYVTGTGILTNFA